MNGKIVIVPSHGFTAGKTLVGLDNGAWVSSANPVALVTKVIDSNTVVLASQGYVTGHYESMKKYYQHPETLELTTDDGIEWPPGMVKTLVGIGLGSGILLDLPVPEQTQQGPYFFFPGPLLETRDAFESYTGTPYIHRGGDLRISKMYLLQGLADTGIEQGSVTLEINGTGIGRANALSSRDKEDLLVYIPRTTIRHGDRISFRIYTGTNADAYNLSIALT